MSESQFSYLFTLKNAHLSSDSYNFRLQPNIPMKFAGYVARILLCKYCKFGEKNFYNSGDIEFFLWDYFFGAPCTYYARCQNSSTILTTCTNGDFVVPRTSRRIGVKAFSVAAPRAWDRLQARSQGGSIEPHPRLPESVCR